MSIASTTTLALQHIQVIPSTGYVTVKHKTRSNVIISEFNATTTTSNNNMLSSSSSSSILLVEETRATILQQQQQQNQQQQSQQIKQTISSKQSTTATTHESIALQRQRLKMIEKAKQQHLLTTVIIQVPITQLANAILMNQLGDEANNSNNTASTTANASTTTTRRSNSTNTKHAMSMITKSIITKTSCSFGINVRVTLRTLTRRLFSQSFNNCYTNVSPQQLHSMNSMQYNLLTSATSISTDEYYYNINKQQFDLTNSVPEGLNLNELLFVDLLVTTDKNSSETDDETVLIDECSCLTFDLPILTMSSNNVINYSMYNSCADKSSSLTRMLTLDKRQTSRQQQSQTNTRMTNNINRSGGYMVQFEFSGTMSETLESITLIL